MAESTTRVQRWDQGVLVEDYTIEKPVEQFNAETIRERVEAALDVNTQIITGADEFLAITSPTNAQLSAQVRALTTAAKLAAQQRNRLIRLVLQRFNSAD